MAKKKKKTSTPVKWWALGYGAVLFLLTLRPFSPNVVQEKEYNLILFRSISNYIRHMKGAGLVQPWAWSYFPGNLSAFVRNIFTVSFINVFGNVLLFVPLGVLLASLFQKNSGRKTILGCFLVSAGIEIAQFIGLSSRIADIDDVVLNVAGGVLGTILHWVITTGRKRKGAIGEK